MSFCNGSISLLGAASSEYEKHEKESQQKVHCPVPGRVYIILSVLHTLSHSFLLTKIAHLSLTHPHPKATDDTWRFQDRFVEHAERLIGVFRGGQICNSVVPALAGTYIGCSSG